jgi:uncharacterized protein
LLEIKLSDKLEPATLRALIPGTPVPDRKKREAIEFAARAYLDGTLEQNFPATSALLLRRAPRLRGRRRGAKLQPAAVTKESVSSAIGALERSYLFVQGPPGSGKSTSGAWAIVDLLAAGKRVALAAQSHKAVHALLRKIETTACERGLRLRGCHKASESTKGSYYEPLAEWPMVETATDASAYDGYQLVSGTTFAWAAPSQRGAFDYVVIDEAGQMSLADALATSLVARNVVLLGDPQQLPQVSQGSHPIGVSVSILEHLLGRAKTIAPERGMFLDTSYRMQPAISNFVSEAMYDGRLHASARNIVNRIESSGLRGGGLVYVPVVHAGNTRHSREEAERIAREIERLLDGGYVTLPGREERPLTERDVLVVAPFNTQRAQIEKVLKAANLGGIRVGTVDKFQGQEAPVVFYSMGVSSGADAPRGMDFIFSANRFNVAVSRAQVMSVLVCSPALLGSSVTNAEQMTLVNLLCAYVEHASEPNPRLTVKPVGAIDIPVNREPAFLIIDP